MAKGRSGLERFKAFEAEGWSRRAETYEDVLGAVTPRVAEPLLDAAGVRAGSRVLDVASGPGYAAERAAARGAEPVGIDISERMVELARARQPRLDFRVADAERLPFDAGSFDAVVGGFVLNHLPDPERALDEAARVLSPGGAVAFSVWDRPERNRLIGVFSDAIAEAGAEPPPEVANGPDPYRFSDDAELKRVLAAAGFADPGVETLSLEHSVSDVESLWRGVMGSSVRTRAVIEAQPEATRARIREALANRMRAHRREHGFELPVVVKLGSALLPGSG